MLEPMNTPPLIVACGGGLNTWAMMLGMHDRDVRPDLILFADTGGEKPETYQFLDALDSQFAEWDWPPLLRVAYGKFPSLEANCLAKNMLPSLAYGFKKCSLKYKKYPQEMFVKYWAPAIAAWHSGEMLTKAIGFDADEGHRKMPADGDGYRYWYPLIEWDWGRDDCLSRAKESGIVPPKSSCFFCPASRKAEILALTKDLQERAIAMERNAELTSVKGLGRRFSWEALISADERQGKLFPEADEIACMCFDGD